MKNETVVVWHKDKLLDNIRVHQAYIFAITPTGDILLVRDQGEERFTLPGGAIEKDESADEGIQRELQEEAQVACHDLKLLGVIEVKVYDENGKITDHHQQARYAGKVDTLGKFVPMKDGFEVEERITVDPFELPDYISWIKKPNGLALLAAYFEYASEI